MKKVSSPIAGFLCLIFVGLITAPAAFSQCAPPPAGLVSWWRGEGDGVDAAGSNNLVLLNGVGFVQGAVGQGFAFSGSNQCARIEYSPALISSNYTVEAWIKPTAQVSDLIDQDFVFGQSFGLCQLAVRPGTTGVRVVFQFGTSHYSFYEVAGAAELPIGEFSHVAGTWDGVTLRLYINGVLSAQSSPGVVPVDAGCPFWVGGFYSPAGDNCQYVGQFFEGVIDELSYYTRSLSGTEVQAIYQAGNTGKCVPPACMAALSGLVSWWRGEGDGVDAAGSNNLVLLNGVGFVQGAVGQGFAFSGSNQCARIDYSPALISSNYTVEAWIKPTAQVSDLIDQDFVFGQSFGLCQLAVRPGTTGVRVVFQFGTSHYSFYEVAGAAELPIGEFSHVAGTWDGVTLRLYINGVLSAESSPGVVPVDAGCPFWVGGFYSPAGDNCQYVGQFFEGVIDELSYYTRSLSGTEVQAIYQAGSAGKCATVPLPPGITTQPAGKTVYVGGSATFNVAAVGDAPLGYQWRFNEADLPGKTGASLALANVQLTNAGDYSVVITNPVGSVTSVVAVLTVKIPPPCTPPPAGLVSWWRFENSLLDNWDSNNGTAPYGALYSAGKAGQAFSATSSRFVVVPDSPSLRLTNALTLEAWVYPTSLSGLMPRTILSKYDFQSALPSGMQSSFILGTTNNGLVYFAVSATGSVRTNTTILTLQPLVATAWSHVVATYDGALLCIYVNGSLAVQTNYSGGVFAGNSALGIGALPYGSSGYLPFTGLIDEVSIYNRALSASEIQDIYNSDFTGKCFVAPTLISQPQSRTLPLGEDVKFSVNVQGSRPLTYQWSFMPPPPTTGWQILKDATNATLLLEKVQANAGGLYSVVVSNVMGSVASSNAMLSFLPALTCTSLPSNAISWWPADGSAMDAVDGNSGIFAAGLYATGKVGSAFSFNGYSSRVVIPHSASLNVSSNDGFSVEAWIKAYAATPPQTSIIYPNMPLIEKRTVAGSSGTGYSLSLYQGRLACWLGTSPVSIINAPLFISSGPDLRDGMFHHVAMTLDRNAANGGNLFVDGQLVLTFDARTRAGDLSNSSMLYLGAPTTTSSNAYFYGLMDEVALYRRALSRNEIAAQAGAGSAGRCKEKAFIIDQPASQRVNYGSNATFNVVAGGTPTVRYQWRFNGVPIPGATNVVYTLNNVTVAGSLSVIVSNAFGGVISSNAALTLNRPPVAINQSVTLAEDTSAAVVLTGSDPDGDVLRCLILTPPVHGSLDVTSSNVVYTPNLNYSGADSFTFAVNDGLLSSMPAAVTLDIQPVNDAPTALGQTVGVDEDAPVSITLNAHDPDGDALIWNVGSPAHGTLTGVAPNLVYQPAANHNGPDSFTFAVSDGSLTSAMAAVTITIRPVNDAPVPKMAIAPLFEFPGITNLLAIAPDGRAVRLALDGSASSDVDGDSLSHVWADGTNQLSTVVACTNTFEVGLHEFILTVHDGTVSAVDQKTVEVIAPAQAVSFLIDLVSSSTLPRNSRRPLLASLQSAEAAFEHGKLRAGINQLNAFQHKVKAQVAPQDAALAALLQQTAQRIIDALKSPSALVQLLDSLHRHINGSALSSTSKRSLCLTVDSAGLAVKLGKFPEGAGYLRNFQNKVQVQVAPASPVLSQDLSDQAQDVLDTLNGY